MRQLRFSLWATGNILLLLVIVPGSWFVALPIGMLLEHAWPVSVALFALLPFGTVFWPVTLFVNTAVSVALVRLSLRRKGRLADLSYHFREVPRIELTTTDPSVTRWHDLSTDELIPGWGAVAAAYLLTASGCLAIAGMAVFDWPMWACGLLLIPWAGGWAWYALLVRARVWVSSTPI